MKVSGSDTDGNPFQQTAYAWDVSHWGARIDGIMCLKKPGQLLDVQYQGKTAKFIVVWMGKPGTKEHGHIGIKNLVPGKNIFGVAAPAICRDTHSPRVEPHPAKAAEEAKSHARENPAAPRPAQNRRQYTRHTCVGDVEFRIAGSKTSMFGDLADLSLGGCYIKVQATCPKGTMLELVLIVGDTRLHARGKVAVVNPAIGMGVEFTSSDRSISRLPALINTIRSRKN